MTVGALAGRVVVVTGASRGIGAGIVDCLTAADARVLGVSRTPPSGGEETRAETDAGSDAETGAETETDNGSQADGGSRWLSCDLLDPDAPERVLAGALEAYGRVDALVNNAGALIEGACWEQSDAELDAMVMLNLTAPFLLSQRFARHWRDRATPGVVVNVCSVESHVAWADPPQAAYAATKGGLLGLTRAMALELAPLGIRVVAVGPGAIATAMTPDAPRLREAIPLGGRLGRPEEIGEVVAFLLSDAASYITGEIVYADGGYLLA